MLLFAGLGNPGPRYAANRHNVGFLALDAIHRRHGFAPWRRRFRGETSDGLLGKEPVMLLKPATYMNLSGDSVAEAMQYFRIPVYKLTVFHDEIELPPAKIRLKTGGSDAGHNGLRSITERAGSEYARVRIGVGRPVNKQDVERYVLQDFPKNEWPWVEAVQEAIAEHIELVAAGRPEEFQNRVHLFLRAKGFDEPPAAPND